MKPVTATTRILISGGGNCWKIATARDHANTVQERMVRLEIIGNDKDGYHLNMSPEGCFTADYWYETLDGAKQSALELFKIDARAWTPATHS